MTGAYGRLKMFVGRYNRTQQSVEELANQFWLEYSEGNYAEVEANAAVPEAFIRSFVKKRCKRELTKQIRASRRHIALLSGTSEDWHPGVMHIDRHQLQDENCLDPEGYLACDEHRMQVRASLKKIIVKLSSRDTKIVINLMRGKTRRQVAKLAGVSLGTAQNVVVRLRLMSEMKELRDLVAGI